MSTDTAEKPKVTVTVDQITAKYIQLRDRVADIKEKHKQELAPYTEAMDKLETVLLAQLDALGAQSISTPSGTPYISRRTSATVADWPLYFDWLTAQDKVSEGLDHKASKSFVEAYIEANEDLPPGINYTSERTVNVKRK